MAGGADWVWTRRGLVVPSQGAPVRSLVEALLLTMTDFPYLHYSIDTQDLMMSQVALTFDRTPDGQ